jgi:ubiquitin-protein ligase E3 C
VLQQDMYGMLRQHLMAIPIEKKSAPSLPSATSLAVLPLKSSNPTALLPAFVRNILTIPLLLHRLPASSVSTLASGLPYDILLEWLASNTASLVRSDQEAINLLTNLTPLVEPRIKAFGNVQQLLGWLELCTICISFIPTSLLSRIDKGKGRSTDMDIDDDSALSTASSLSLHPKVAQQLRKVSSAADLEPLLASSARFSSSPKSRPAIGRFLVALLTVLPSKSREELLTFLLYHKQGGGGLLREIWRGWLRSGELWKSIVGDKGKEGWRSVAGLLSSKTTPPGQLTEWPLLLLFVQLYTRMLLTLGDDEFYAGSAAKTRNPILLDDIKTLSALLRNIGFALYWGETSIDQLAVPGVANVTGEELRSLVRTLLVAIHERE